MSRPLHVFILCHRGDQIFTRICVASVRFWYPDISIYLLKDDGVRPFSTKEIEKRWRVSVLSAAGIKASRLMNKFRMFVCSLEGRALYIDSDIVFLGRVFDVLDTYTEDILISAEQMPDPGAPQVSEWYYDWAKLKEFDPKFSYPSYCFNAGQFAWTLGKINYSDFQSIVVSGRHLELTRPDIFHCGDQGAMNYVIQKKDQDGNCTVGRAEFAKWINDPVASNYELANLSAGNGYPVLLHWLVQNLLLRKDAPVGHIALLRTVLLFPHSISNYQTEF